MSDLEEKGDAPTSAASDNLPPDKSVPTTTLDEAENIKKSMEIGDGDKEAEYDATLLSTDSVAVQKDSEKLTSSGVSENDPQASSSETDKKNDQKDENFDINITLSQEDVIKDLTPDKQFKMIKDTHQDGNDNTMDEENDDIELKWDDDDKDDCSMNLSEEALKLLDIELGIDEAVSTKSEINPELSVKNTDSVKKTDMPIIEDNSANINNTLLKSEEIETKITKTEDGNTIIGDNTKKPTEINKLSEIERNVIDKEVQEIVCIENKDVQNNTTSESEIIQPDTCSKGVNEETNVSNQDIPKEILKIDEIDNHDVDKQQSTEIITDGSFCEIDSVNPTKLDESPLTTKIDNSQITPNITIKPQITPNIEMDIDTTDNINKQESIDSTKDISETSENEKSMDTIKISESNDIAKQTTNAQEIMLAESTDVEMLEATDQIPKEIDVLEQKEQTQKVAIDDNIKTDTIASENIKNTESDSVKNINEKETTKGMKTDLGLNKPDVMLEIPTQELIDIDEFDDTFEIEKEDQTNITTNITDKITESINIGKEKDQLVETIDKMDNHEVISDINQPIIDNIAEKPITDNMIESTSNVNNKNIDNVPEESISNNDNITDSGIKSDENIETISEPNICMTDQTNINILKETSNTHDTITTEVSKDNQKMTVSPSKDDKMADTTLLATNMTVEEHQSDDRNTKESPTTTDMVTEPEMSQNITKVTDKLNITSEIDTNISEKYMAKTDNANTEEITKNIPNTDIKLNDTSLELSSNEAKTAKESLNSDKETDISKNPNDTSSDPITNEDKTQELPINDYKNLNNEINFNASSELNKNTENVCKNDESDEPDISDSLGLLAKSSRVMDDDDQDEDDDSDDFDQDDESSNLMTAEHSEESNPPSDETQTDEKETAIPDDTTVEREDIIETDDTNTMDVVDDIVCEETEVLEKVKAIVKANLDSSTTRDNEISQKTQQTEEESSDTAKDSSVLKELLIKETKQGDESQISPNKSIRLSISTTNERNVMTYVDLDDSDDEIQVIKREKRNKKKESTALINDEIEEQNVTQPQPKPTFKMTKLNTSEVSIKTGVSNKPPLIIPEITNVTEIEKAKLIVETKQSLEEVFNIDSDSEEEEAKKPIEKICQPKFNPKCINPMCTSPSSDQHYVADAGAMRHYGATKRRAICAPCLADVDFRNEELIKGIKVLTPLLDLNMDKPTNHLVEISDSESEDESDVIKECKQLIGQEGATMLNEKLAALLNETWQKFNMDDRLKDSENCLNAQLKKLEVESNEVNKILNECQTETDRIRNELYKTFERGSKSLPPLIICDSLPNNYSCHEKEVDEHNASRLRNALEEPPAKRQNRGVTPNKEVTPPSGEGNKEDGGDVSVVLLSAEAAPPDLPPPGEVVRPPLRVGQQVHAMRNAFGSWLRGRILDIQPKLPGQPYTMCRVKFDHNIKNPCKVLPGRCIAYQVPCNVRMTIGTRVIALFKDESNRKESFYSGVVAEIPNPVNNYRYLVFFDDGYAQYVKHKDTRLVCETKSLVWEEVHPFIRDFVKDYLLKYPERPMVRLHAGQRLNTEWNGKWWTSKVLQVDGSLAHVHFEEDNRTEWIYRGSTRLAPLYLELQAAGRSRTRLPRSKAQFRTNMPYVEYMRSEEQSKQQQQLQQEEMIRRQRAVAKKSVSLPQPTPMEDRPDSVTSPVVYYTPKNAVKPYKMVPHTCGPSCKRTDVLSLKELRTYNPLAKPLLSGWERLQVRFKGSKHIMYRAPCGRRIRDMRELHQYLRATQSDFPVDLFDFNVNTHCLAEFVLQKYNVMKKDLSHGKESVPVPCVNYYDDSLPEFCSYNTERTPTAGVPLNIDPDFLCGCDCEDDCEDKSKCACWKMTLEGARTIGLDSPNVGYVYRRLPEPLPSGIYECNSRCKCKSTCLNRVAQHPLQLKLQVFKTLKRGWGIRALNDIPKGAFLCVYAGNLLTDATANLDGLNEGDEYLAELDYIEVVEQMKEGYEEDIPDDDKKLDKKESKKSASEDEATESEDDNHDSDQDDKADDDFQPGCVGLGLTEFSKRLRKRGKKKQNDEEQDKDIKEKDSEEQKSDDCITISDDEELREPSRFTAQAGMGDNGFISKYRSVRSLFGKDEACYIMDAKVQGNIGRYLNHSCCPNVFVQNVFVDTHDPRFPWVAFFALSHIRAGTELTWNYNYDIGSVPGKILYCYCGAHNCRGRLL